MLLSSVSYLAREHHLVCTGSRPSVALLVLSLLLVGVTVGYSTTMKPDRYDLHSIDDRGPAIDPYWYVDRGVRPIGRFGKRQSSDLSLVRNLEFLLRFAWNEKVRSLRGAQRVDASDWLP